jgi:hypothetical protein
MLVRCKGIQFIPLPLKAFVNFAANFESGGGCHCASAMSVVSSFRGITSKSQYLVYNTNDLDILDFTVVLVL